ncbi:MAG: glycosyltransferase [Lachnospiraceae bacterium]|nr:glycosyltransferase [Lachnospiraceae bacterium]
MKVTHVITVNTGGAYTAVRRIAECLESEELHSVVLLRNSVKNCENIQHEENVFLDSTGKIFFSKAGNLMNLIASSKDVDNDLFANDISDNESIRSADVIFIHWINSFLSYAKLKRIKESIKKPIIIVMHDMWHATGGCHYSIGCDRYINGCISCPKVGYVADKAMKLCIKRKKQFFSSHNPYMVTISDWEKSIALSSSICNCDGINSNRIFRIWNPINTEIFKPYQRDEIRTKYQIGDRPVILFGADRLRDEVKGVKYIFDALKHLDISNYIVICFGIKQLPEELKNDHAYIRCLGRIEDEHSLAEIYSMADVYVTTAVQEAFGYTCCESLACGTPVVAFAIGGMLDQIIHKQTGFLAEPNDAESVAKGIEYCIENRTTLGDAARKSVLGRFDYKTIGKQYKDLIQRVVNDRS